MGYLAFHSEQVANLHRALNSALDQLANVWITDPEVESEHYLLGTAIRRLGHWYPILSGISGCVALKHYENVGNSLKKDDLTVALWTGLSNVGYQIVHDPLGTTINDPYLEAQQLAIALQTNDLEKLLSKAELEWLAPALTRLMETPAGMAGLLDTLGEDGINKLIDAIQHQSDRAYAVSDFPKVKAADETLAALGAMIGEHRRNGGSPDPQAVLGAVDPMAAALMLEAMGLASEDLGRLGFMILDRSRPDFPNRPIRGMSPLRCPGDIVIPLIGADPVASRAFYPLAADDLDIIFLSSHRPEDAAQIIVNVTDPAVVTATEAGAIIHPILEYLMHALPWTFGSNDYTFLGTIVAPYLLEFTSGPGGGWPWRADVAPAVAMKFILGFDGNLGALLESTMALVNAAIAGPAGNREVALEAIAKAIAMTFVARQYADIESAIDDKAMWNFLTGLGIGAASELPIAGGPVVGLTFGLMVGAGGEAVKKFFEENGWLGAPPSDEMIRQVAAGDLDAQMSLFVFHAVSAVLGGARFPRHIGPPPVPQPQSKDGCAGNAYREDLAEWLLAARQGGADPERIDLADEIVDILLPSSTASGNCTHKALS